MQHRRKGRTLSRTRDQRRALLRTLAGQLIMRGAVATSEAKAKELRPAVERLVTIAKAGTIATRRELIRRLPEAAAAKLIRDIAPRFSERPGGYTRITKLGLRRSDGSRRALIAFVS